MTKKILTISAVILFIILLGMAYYFLFYIKNNPNNNTATGNTPENNFFPFGQNNPSGGATSTNSTGEPNTPVTTESYTQKLRLITNEPVAGAKFLEDKTGVWIRYMEKATGHIYDVATFSNSINKISNTTIPQIYETLFTEKGTSFIARYVESDNETIESTYGKIATISTSTPQNQASSTKIVSGTMLSSNINWLAVSPNGANIFYLQTSANGSTGILAKPNGSAKKQIWDSKIRSVLPQFLGENQILLTTKPNVSTNGYAYLVDAKTGSVKNILGNLPDLSTLANPSGASLLYYTSAGGNLSVYTIAGANNTEITPTALPEKCVFDQSNKNIFYCAVPKNPLSFGSLDNWYLGLISFSDDIWKYDLNKGTSSMIENLKSDAGRDIDATNLQINSASSLLLFQSKSDGSLWSLTI